MHGDERKEKCPDSLSSCRRYQSFIYRFYSHGTGVRGQFFTDSTDDLDRLVYVSGGHSM